MSLTEFKSLFSDLLRPNYFEVIIEPPQKLSGIDTSSFKYLAITTDFPFETIVPKEYIALSRKYKIAGNVDYDPFTISFYLDSQGKLLDFFERWKKLIVNDENKMGYYNDYTGTMKIKMLDRKKNNIFEVKLVDVYPVNRNNISLNNNTTDSFIEMSISFEYLRAEYIINGAAYQSDYSPSDFNSITKAYGLVTGNSGIIPGMTKGNGNYSPLGGDFLSFNPFEKQIGDALNKLGTDINKTFGNSGLPQISSFGTTLSSTLGDKIKNTQKTIMAPIQTGINDLQTKITSKYKDLQQKTKQRLQDAASKTLKKIFKF